MYNNQYNEEGELYSYATATAPPPPKDLCGPQCLSLYNFSKTSQAYKNCCKTAPKKEPNVVMGTVDDKNKRGATPPAGSGLLAPKGVGVGTCSPDCLFALPNKATYAKCCAKHKPKTTPEKPDTLPGVVATNPPPPDDGKFNFKEYFCADPVNKIKASFQGGTPDEAGIKCLIGWGGLALVGILVLQKLKL